MGRNDLLYRVEEADYVCGKFRDYLFVMRNEILQKELIRLADSPKARKVFLRNFLKFQIGEAEKTLEAIRNYLTIDRLDDSSPEVQRILLHYNRCRNDLEVLKEEVEETLGRLDEND